MRALAKALKETGFIRQQTSPHQLPFTYLGADDEAGPNDMGRPAVHSCYELL